MFAVFCVASEGRGHCSLGFREAVGEAVTVEGVRIMQEGVS